MDPSATGFSLKNALFVAKLSGLVYTDEGKSVDERREHIKTVVSTPLSDGGFGFNPNEFHWYQALSYASGASYCDAIEDTQAMIVANDDAIVVIFRGSKGIPDWTTNCKVCTRLVPAAWGVHLGKVHTGFDNGVETVWHSSDHMVREQGIIETLHSLLEAKRRKVFLGGHSLGGGLATIAAARLAFEENICIAGLYVVGSPRIFNSAMAATFNKHVNHGTALVSKCFRARNHNDIVTKIPLIDFHHIGEEKYFDKDGNLLKTPREISLWGVLTNLFVWTCVDGVRDHSCDTYIELFEKALHAKIYAVPAHEQGLLKQA